MKPWRVLVPVDFGGASHKSDLSRSVPSRASRRRYTGRVRPPLLMIVAITSLAASACSDESPVSATQPSAATLRIVFFGSTTRRSDLPASAQACVGGVGATHIHPSWRDFAGISLQPVPPDRYQITFSDVPLDTRVSFRINDQNSCDENPTGAVTRNVFANDVRLIQNATTPVDEPGYALTVAANGTVSQ